MLCTWRVAVLPMKEGDPLRELMPKDFGLVQKQQGQKLGLDLSWGSQGLEDCLLKMSLPCQKISINFGNLPVDAILSVPFGKSIHGRKIITNTANNKHSRHLCIEQRENAPN